MIVQNKNMAILSYNKIEQKLVIEIIMFNNLSSIRLSKLAGYGKTIDIEGT